MAETESKPAENNVTAARPFLLSIGDISQLTATTLAICYVSGFIIVMAYLGSFGIKDYEAFRTQYIISGGTLLLIGGLYYYFVGNHILTIDDETETSKKIFAAHGAKGRFWDFCAFTFPVWRLGYFIAATSLIGSSLLFDITSTLLVPLIVPMVAGFFWIESVLTSKASESIGKLFWLLTEVFYLLVFLAFYHLADGLILDFTNFILVATGIGFAYANAVHSIEPAHVKKVSAYFFVFAIVALSGIFGRYFYGHIKPSIGGGEPIQVKVVVDEETPNVLQKELNVSDSLSSTVNLIAQTDSELFLGFPSNESTQGYKTVIKIDKELVKAVISSDVSVIKYIKQQ